MSPEDIQTIRDLRGCGIAWKTVASTLQKSVDECRRAIGLPPKLQEQSRQPLPWEASDARKKT